MKFLAQFQGVALVVVAGSLCSVLPAHAQSTTYYHARIHKPSYARHPVHHYFATHPKVRAATIGAGVGLGAGALTGLISHRGIVRGALIGAGTGAGVGLIRSSYTMRRHPIFRDVATGGAIGLGTSWAIGRGGLGQGAAVGSALGLGAGLLMHGI